MSPDIPRTIRPGTERLPARSDRPRHKHLEGYATVVLAGSFLEASFAGIVRVHPGDVLLHGRFDCHANRQLSRNRITLLRLPWLDDATEGRFVIRDPDRLARISERDPWEALGELKEQLLPVRPKKVGWLNELATALATQPALQILLWAQHHGCRTDILSRHFGREFGVTPKRFRLEARTRRAWRAVVHTTTPLTQLAADFDFADLAHMSRSVKAVTGKSPSQWRSPIAVKSVQAVPSFSW